MNFTCTIPLASNETKLANLNETIVVEKKRLKTKLVAKERAKLQHLVVTNN